MKNLFSNSRCSSLTFNLQLSMVVDSLTIESQLRPIPRQIQDSPCFEKVKTFFTCRYTLVGQESWHAKTWQDFTTAETSETLQSLAETGDVLNIFYLVHTSSTKTLGSGLTVTRRPCLWVIKVWTFIDLIRGRSKARTRVLIRT